MDQQQDVKLANTAKHMVKFCVQKPVSGTWSYPFVQHERVDGWLQIILDPHQTIYLCKLLH